MSKKRKKTKKPVQQQQGAFKRFLSDAHEIMNTLGYGDIYECFSNSMKRDMYQKLFKFKNPTIGNGYVSNTEISLLTDTIKKQYREKLFNFDETYISAHQLQVYSCCISASVDYMNRTTNIYSEDELKIGQEAQDLVSQEANKLIMIKILYAANKLSSPDYKYFNISINPVYNSEDNRLEFKLEVFGIPSQKKMFKLNGHNRPIYRIANYSSTNEAQWLTIKTSLFKDIYKGDKEEIDVYIQSHALKRLAERLDLLDKKAINYALNENTCTLQYFDFYKGYIFLKFIVHDIKVGYLVASIIDDKLIFRTFLFVTHNSTPEGDKLKEITGLEKNDVSYWKIDRLSTLVNINEEAYPELVNIFKDAGLEDLIQLKDKDFNVDKMQITNLDAFMDFLNKSQESMKLINKEVMIPEEIY